VRTHTAPQETANGFSSNMVEYGLEILDISNFSSDRTAIKDTLHQDTLVNAPLRAFRSNTLNINLRNKCFKRKLQRRIMHNFMSSTCLMVLEIIKQNEENAPEL
jgi:hypothetical protein